MEEAENVDPKYVEGFNQGYYLAKHTPELADKLSSLTGNNPRLEGMKNGIEQYALEHSKDITPDWLKKDRLSQIKLSNSTSKEKGKER